MIRFSVNGNSQVRVIKDITADVVIGPPPWEKKKVADKDILCDNTLSTITSSTSTMPE